MAIAGKVLAGLAIVLLACALVEGRIVPESLESDAGSLVKGRELQQVSAGAQAGPFGPILVAIGRKLKESGRALQQLTVDIGVGSEDVEAKEGRKLKQNGRALQQLTVDIGVGSEDVEAKEGRKLKQNGRDLQQLDDDPIQVPIYVQGGVTVG